MFRNCASRLVSWRMWTFLSPYPRRTLPVGAASGNPGADDQLGREPRDTGRRLLQQLRRVRVGGQERLEVQLVEGHVRRGGEVGERRDQAQLGVAVAQAQRDSE